MIYFLIVIGYFVAGTISGIIWKEIITKSLVKYQLSWSDNDSLLLFLCCMFPILSLPLLILWTFFKVWFKLVNFLHLHIKSFFSKKEKPLKETKFEESSYRSSAEVKLNPKWKPR